jgi:hypothetical protein
MDEWWKKVKKSSRLYIEQAEEKSISNLEDRIEKREGYIEEQWEREEEDNSLNIDIEKARKKI